MTVTRRALGTLGLSMGVFGVPHHGRASPATHRHGPERGQAPAHPERPLWQTLPPTPALPMAKRSGLITVRGNPLWFAQFGDGPPVLFLHGGMANSDYWGHQLAEIAKTHTATVMDTRGHGRSPLTAPNFSYRAFADDAVGLLDALSIPSTAVVGWSDGAITGLELAMSSPSRVTKLFAFGANATPDGLIPHGNRSAVFLQFAARCQGEYRTLSPQPGQWPALKAGLDAMWHAEPNYPRTVLAGIRLPTAISDGEHDEIIKPDHSARIAKDIPGAQLLIQPGVSHFAMLQNPGQFNRTLLGFLAA